VFQLGSIFSATVCQLPFERLFDVTILFPIAMLLGVLLPCSRFAMLAGSEVSTGMFRKSAAKRRI